MKSGEHRATIGVFDTEEEAHDVCVSVIEQIEDQSFNHEKEV